LPFLNNQKFENAVLSLMLAIKRFITTGNESVEIITLAML